MWNLVSLIYPQKVQYHMLLTSQKLASYIFYFIGEVTKSSKHKPTGLSKATTQLELTSFATPQPIQINPQGLSLYDLTISQLATTIFSTRLST